MKHLGRKLYHLLGGICLLALYYLLGRHTALTLYAGLFLLVLAVEAVRLSLPAVNEYVYAHFAGFLRQKERHTLTGTPPYILGIGLSLFLFRPDIAAAAVCFLAFGDVAATTIGERYGRVRIGEKSLEGTLAFVAAALGAGFLLHVLGVGLSPGMIAAGAVIAAGVELLSLPVNDNLLIPLVSGGVMELIARTAGGS